MKKSILLVAISMMGAQAHASEYLCSVMKKSGESIDSHVFTSGDEPLRIYDGENNVVTVSETAKEGTWELLSYNPKTLEIQARANAELRSIYIQVLDIPNQQVIMCDRLPEKKKVVGGLKITPTYVSMAGEGGGLGDPTPPPASGCWIISCAY